MDELRPQFGEHIGNKRVSGGAYADDLILFAEATKGLLDQTIRLLPVLTAHGLELNPAKCVTFRLGADGKRKKVYADMEHKLEVNGKNIPRLEIGQSCKYLGIEVGYEGVRKLTRLPELEDGLRKLTAAPLKPQQRLYLLKQHLLAGLQHKLEFQPVASGKLKRRDQQFRKHFRGWLKLLHDVPDSFLHAAVTDGKQGIHRVAATAWLARRDRLNSLANQPDPILQQIFEWKWFSAKRTLLEQKLRIGQASCATRQEILTAKKKALCDTVDGRGLAEANKYFWKEISAI